MKLIDKDKLVERIEKRRDKNFNFGGSPSSEYCYEDDEILRIIDTLEVKKVDLKDCDAMNGKIDDSDISCNCTSCSVHTTCKYFNPEKESNVKHCFGGVPMQLKQRKESAVKEVDLEKEIELWYNEYAGNLIFDWNGFAKHFFELGLKARQS